MVSDFSKARALDMAGDRGLGRARVDVVRQQGVVQVLVSLPPGGPRVGRVVLRLSGP